MISELISLCVISVTLHLCNAHITTSSGFPTTTSKITVLHSSTSIDKEFQSELLKAVFASLRDLDTEQGISFIPEFIELTATFSPEQAAQRVWNNSNSTVLISLLNEHQLSQFASGYDTILKSGFDQGRQTVQTLTIYTPRIVDEGLFPSCVTLLSMQMNKRAFALALLNRMKKVGLEQVIPVLDSGDEFQSRWLTIFEEGGHSTGIKMLPPIFISKHKHDIRKEMLKINPEHNNMTSQDRKGFGVLLLATKGSRLALRIASEQKHVQMGRWFSPSILEHEEWAFKDDTGSSNNNGTAKKYHSHFGLYTSAFVGMSGWDNNNPDRRRVLPELTKYTGATPRILSSILAYDTATIAVNHVRKLDHNYDHRTTLAGLSGLIEFDPNDGSRAGPGVFFGLSAIPTLASRMATLLQPSTWILEDNISVKKRISSETHYLTHDFQIATSSMFTRTELASLVNRSREDVGCSQSQHIMKIITYDPFNQMPYNYYFKEENLPEYLLIPNQHGFGITFVCLHSENNDNNKRLVTSLKVACTPGFNISEPIQCFRSDVKLRQKRGLTDLDGGLGQQDVLSPENANNFNLPQNSQWSSPSYNQDNVYLSSDRRQDSTTGAPPPPPPTPAPPPKPVDLRQVLKAAKPFAGSCIGAATGCAMCVLVLGRLPLSAVPAICSGPCFVGTFGVCGALLGRTFSETTVICTELYRQGYMDVETFLADAEYGKILQKRDPAAMQGYTLLATPLVNVMKNSPFVTSIVAFFALPWAQHIKYLTGRTQTSNFFGFVLHTTGFPICKIVGHIYVVLNHQKEFIFDSQIIAIFTTLIIALLTILLKKVDVKKRLSKSSILKNTILFK